MVDRRAPLAELVPPCAAQDRESTLEDLDKHFEVLIVGAEDCSDCNLSEHFEKIAGFMERGRALGGVVVHCAAGISRASTSACAYLMLKDRIC